MEEFRCNVDTGIFEPIWCLDLTGNASRLLWMDWLRCLQKGWLAGWNSSEQTCIATSEGESLIVRAVRILLLDFAPHGWSNQGAFEVRQM